MKNEVRSLAKRTIVVLPTFNESENISRLITTITHCFEGVQIFVIDDNSPDGTGRIVDELAADSQLIRIEHRPSKLGLGSAYRYALSHPFVQTFDFIVQMDSDFSHDPTEIPNFVTELNKGNDFVIGSRYIQEGKILDWSARRRLLSRFGNFYIRLMMQLEIRDCTSGFRAFKQKALAQIEPENVPGEGYIFIAAMAKRGAIENLAIKEIPITFIDRTNGRSKMSKKIIFESLIFATRFKFRPGL